MKKKATIAALLAVIATCFALIFRNVSAGMDDGYVPAWQREMIKQFDKDGDGTLNKAEKEAAQAAAQAGEERRKGFIREFDKDGDGKLDEGERKAASEVWAAREKTRIQQFDKDGDGKLSREEREAAGRPRNR